MDPRTLRWKLEAAATEKRRERSATFWKVVVGAVSSAVLTTIAVSTLLDRPDDAESDPSITQTSAAQMPTPSVPRIQTPVPSSATIAPTPAVTVIVSESVPAATMSVPEAATSPVVERVVATPLVAPPAPAAEAEADAAPEPVVAAEPSAAEPPSPSPAPVASAPPAPTSPFETDAPPWSASSWVSDPDAGAGPFTTDWNIPAYGAYWTGWAY